MTFTRYPKAESNQITPRKVAAARRAVQKEQDLYVSFQSFRPCLDLSEARVAVTFLDLISRYVIPMLLP
jgi:hypothetical protein